MRFAPCLLVVLAACAALLAARGGASDLPALAIDNPSTDSPHLLGDANCSGAVDAADSLADIRQAAGLRAGDSCIVLGNVNCDSAVDAVDALAILDFVAGIPSTAPTDCPTVGSSSLRILTIDKFGDGTVSGDLPAAECAAGCSKRSVAVSSGTVFHFTASATTGSSFSHWTGCEPASGTGCSLTADSDKTVLATFAITDAQIPATTKVVDADVTQHLLNSDGSTFTFDGSATIVATLAPGDIIISSVGQGFIRKVTSIQMTANQIIVQTGQATLEDAIARGTVVLSKATFASALQNAMAAHPQSALSCQISELSCTMPINVDFGDNWHLSGDASLAINPDLAVSFDGFDASCFCWPVHEVRSAITLNQNAHLTLSAGASSSVGKSQDFTLLDVPIDVLVGPLPVHMDLTLDVTLGVEGQAEAGIQSDVTINNSITIGAHYLRDQGWAPISDYSHNFDYSEPVVTANAQAKAYIKPTVNLKLYGVAGPYFGLEAYLRAQANLLQSPWLGLYAGIGAEAGFKATAFGVTLEDFSVPLWAKEWTLQQWDLPPTQSLTPTPLQPACAGYPNTPSASEESSKRAIDDLRPSLPHTINGFQTSTGNVVDIHIGGPEANFPGATRLEIDPFTLYPDWSLDDELPTRIQTFRDAAAAAFDWIGSKDVCVGDLLVYWRSGGGGTGAQSRAFEEWLVPSPKWPAVVCDAHCDFVTKPIGYSTPREALFEQFGSVSPADWLGECNPPDGSSLEIYQSCYLLNERRADTIRFDLLRNRPPDQDGPVVDTFIVYVRLMPEGWKAITNPCSGTCPWPP